MQTKMFSAAISSVGGVVGGAATALAGMFSIHKVVENLDRLGDFAEQADALGIGTQSLMGFQFAARQVGIETEGFNAALRRMLGNIGKLSVDGGEGADALAELGLSAESLDKRGTKEAFLTIADAITKLPSAAQQAAMSMRLFGRDGAKMLALFKGGRKGIEDTMRDLERIGGTITTDVAFGADRAADSFNRMWEANKGVGNELTLSLGPGVEALANTITGAIVKMREFSQEAANFGAEIQTKGRQRLEEFNKKMIRWLTGQPLRAGNELTPEEIDQIVSGGPFGRRQFDPADFMSKTPTGVDVDAGGGKKLRVGGGLRTAKELGLAPTPTSGLGSGVPEKQLSTQAEMLRVLQRIEKKKGSVLAP
jgi:hypothetical protein